MPDATDSPAVDALAEGLRPAGPADASDVEPGAGRRLIGVLRKRPGAIVGAAGLLLLVLVAVLAPVIAPYSPDVQSGAVYGPPSSAHLLGLSDQGVDVLSQLLWACRVSLLVGFAAAVVSIVIGGTVGIVAGYFGGRTDLVLALITDYFIVVPALPVLIVAAAVWGPSLSHIIIVIGVLLWTGTARVVRAQVKSVRERAYVQRARSLGAGNLRIVLRHVLPQIAPLLIASTVLTIAVAIFDETALSFLGLGDPSTTSLGRVIENAFQRAAISAGAWWAIVWPGVLVTLIILGCSLIGGALEDALNPRLGAAHVSARTFRLRPLVGRGTSSL